MSNEELAVKIQAGELNYLPELWEQTKKWITASYKRMLGSNSASQDRFIGSGVTLDDLQQEGYFALLEAVDAYKPDAGYRFITYLKFPLMKRFFTSIGLRTAKGKNDLLTASIRLDKPVAGEDKDITLAETIADENSLTAFENILEDVYREQLHNKLEFCLNRLDSQQQKAIKAKYYNNKTFEQIADELGCSTERARQIIRTALQKLRNPFCLNLLSSFLTDTETPLQRRKS